MLQTWYEDLEVGDDVDDDRAAEQGRKSALPDIESFSSRLVMQLGGILL